MFGPAVLPFFVSCALLFAGWVWWTARGIDDRPDGSAAGRAVAGAAIAVLLVCPLTILLSVVQEPLRYGRYEYATAAEVTSARYPLPPGATAIVLDTGSAGHTAAFTIARDELGAWVRELQSDRPDLPQTDWPADDVFNPSVRVSLAGNGAGFDLSYDDTTGRAEYRMNYW